MLHLLFFTYFKPLYLLKSQKNLLFCFFLNELIRLVYNLTIQFSVTVLKIYFLLSTSEKGIYQISVLTTNINFYLETHHPYSIRYQGDKMYHQAYLNCRFALGTWPIVMYTCAVRWERILAYFIS